MHWKVHVRFGGEFTDLWGSKQRVSIRRWSSWYGASHQVKGGFLPNLLKQIKAFFVFPKLGRASYKEGIISFEKDYAIFSWLPS